MGDLMITAFPALCAIQKTQRETQPRSQGPLFTFSRNLVPRQEDPGNEVAGESDLLFLILKRNRPSVTQLGSQGSTDSHTGEKTM